MHNQIKAAGVKQVTVTLCVVALLGGCAQTKDWMTQFRKSPASSGSTVILGAPDAEQYLVELYELSAGDPATKAEIFADAESASKLTPRPQTNLRFALVLATPAHPNADPERAQNMLRELLTQTELMTPAEISLATIHLKSVEEMMVLGAEARRLRSSNSQAARTQQAAMNQRVSAIEAENRRLRRELSDAEGKLDAITSIERSIRAQDQ